MKKIELVALATGLILLTSACTQEAVPPSFEPTRSSVPTPMPSESEGYDESDDVQPPASTSAVSRPSVPPANSGPMEDS